MFWRIFDRYPPFRLLFKCTVKPTNKHPLDKLMVYWEKPVVSTLFLTFEPMLRRPFSLRPRYLIRNATDATHSSRRRFIQSRRPHSHSTAITTGKKFGCVTNVISKWTIRTVRSQWEWWCHKRTISYKVQILGSTKGAMQRLIYKWQLQQGEVNLGEVGDIK